MIDSDLIALNSARLQSSIDAMEPTSLPGLYVVKDILDAKVMDKLKCYLDCMDDDDSRWQLVENQETMPRLKITWDSETVIEELHEIFANATDKINHCFPDCEKYFWNISLWKDSAGYKLGWHTDNPAIDVAIQIYLYSTPNLGTVFGSDADPVLIPSVHNSGYLAIHPAENKIPHRSESTVPNGVIRYSLYAIWSRLPKHLTDA